MAQANAFRLGVEDFFSASHLRLFTSDELQRDVCGVGDNVDSWDEEAVQKLLKLDGTFRLISQRTLLHATFFMTQAICFVVAAQAEGAQPKRWWR
jgi:hypothetical protein